MEIKNEVVAVDISQEGEGIAKTEEGYGVCSYLLPGSVRCKIQVKAGFRVGRYWNS